MPRAWKRTFPNLDELSLALKRNLAEAYTLGQMALASAVRPSQGHPVHPQAITRSAPDATSSQ